MKAGKTLFTSIILFLCFPLGLWTQESIRTSEPDYSKQNMWYGGITESNKTVDVFYICPTVIFDWTDDSGTMNHFADIDNSKHLEAFNKNISYAAYIFADSCNFYSPYYRQLSLNSWMDGDSVINQRFPTAFNDVSKAFNYYINYENNGRPFILGGFSQGGKCTIELIKEMPDDIRSRMIAAYVIGFPVTDEDLKQCKEIKAANDSIDTGVIISYNSVDNINAICDVLSGGNICINPVNWHTDQSMAKLNDSVTVTVDKTKNVLIVKGLDTKKYFHPQLAKLFKEGNYHLNELNFYTEFLKKNVIQRIRHFKTDNPKCIK